MIKIKVLYMLMLVFLILGSMNIGVIGNVVEQNQTPIVHNYNVSNISQLKASIPQKLVANNQIPKTLIKIKPLQADQNLKRPLNARNSAKSEKLTKTAQTGRTTTTINPVIGFTSTWNTSIVSYGSSSTNQISLPLESTGTYNFTVDWGDGQSGTITSWNQSETTHKYSSPGIYTLNITGILIGWNFGWGNGVDSHKIINISHWGNLNLGNDNSYFFGANNLVITASDAPNMTGTTDLSYMFAFCSELGNMNQWDVSHVTNMDHMFYEATNFNQPIGNWNVSQVTDMNFMFQQDSAFNQPLDNWNVSKVQDMSYMFWQAAAFNQPLDNWNVSQVQLMTNMFDGASSFNQSLDNWNVSKVQDMSYMFYEATAFNQPLDNWNVSQVQNMDSMFTFSHFNEPLDRWDVGNVNDFGGMFELDLVFNQSLNMWNVSEAETLVAMFFDCSMFNQPLDNWNVSQVQLMTNMFGGASSFNQPLDNWNVSKVQDMSYMLDGAPNFDQDLGSWDVYKVTNMMGMFTDVKLSVTNYDRLLEGWSNENLQPNVIFDAGNSRFDPIYASSAKTTILKKFSWFISDGGPAFVPNVPKSIKISPEAGKVLIQWISPNSTGGSPITNYLIYRSSQKDSGYSLIANQSASLLLSYTDNNVTAGIFSSSYYYKLIALNLIGDSNYSTPAMVVVPFNFANISSSVIAIIGSIVFLLVVIYALNSKRKGKNIKIIMTRRMEAGGFSSIQEFKKASKVEANTLEEYRLVQKYKAQSYDEARKIEAGGFTSLKEFRNAQAVKAYSQQEYQLVQKYNAHSYDEARKIENGGYPSLVLYERANSEGYVSYEQYLHKKDGKFDVFVSHSSKDSQYNEDIVSILESLGLTCWVAPRNIEPGVEWAEAIIKGLKSCKIFLLVFTSNSNNSPQVKREVERAANDGLRLNFLKMEDIKMNATFEYFMSNVHWLDATKQDLRKILEGIQ